MRRMGLIQKNRIRDRFDRLRMAQTFAGIWIEIITRIGTRCDVHPDSVAAIRSMAETGSPVRVAQLPGTATPAAANLAFGGLLMLMAALLLWVASRRRQLA